MNNLIFDGHDLGTLFYIGNIERTALSQQAELLEVPGRDGSVFRGLREGAVTVAAPLYILNGTEEERRAKVRTLASWLNVDEPKRLEIDDDGGLWYLAIPNGDISYSRLMNAGTANVSFTLIEPAAYGAEKTVSIPSGGTVSLVVDGTYPTRPFITAPAAVRESSSQVWGLMLDNTDYIKVPTLSASSVRLEIDCDKRTVTRTASRQVVLPTLDSDWFILTQGTHTIRNHRGTGASTIRWVERWL